MKVALIQYWLNGYRGGEKVLNELCEIFPKADIYTHLYVPEALPDSITRHTVRTTFINKLPWAKRFYQYYLPLMPLALEQIDLRGYDLIISCEAGPAKGVLAPPNAVHICYCHSPMRYIWDMYPEYAASMGALKRFFCAPMFHYLRMWDRLSALGVDHFIANSRFIAQRIKRVYNRDAQVLYPPVTLPEYPSLNGADKREDFYLVAGALVPYKRVDLAIMACNESHKQLVIIGDGPEAPRLKAIAGPTIRFLGTQDSAVLTDYYARCRALLFPGAEDFGMVPVEAMAAGAPVIAYATGGALETVVHELSGLFFREQTTVALIAAMLELEHNPGRFDPLLMREHAERFAPQHFAMEIKKLVEDIFAERERCTEDLLRKAHFPLHSNNEIPSPNPAKK